MQFSVHATAEIRSVVADYSLRLRMRFIALLEWNICCVRRRIQQRQRIICGRARLQDDLECETIVQRTLEPKMPARAVSGR